ncbi:response regulator transcription factor [Egicoccus sp. AB-alg6-2]|uniref:response regulator n=1 Tax=Egicoccus sp. AB-alg6-2 TaxID=3242692 RepID=UPI00359D3BA3
MILHVVVVDDDPRVRDALKLIIDFERDLWLAGEATTAEEAARLCAEARPDVAIVDVRMPGGGPEAARQIREVSPTTAVIALTADNTRSARELMHDAGAVAYLVKGATAGEILAAVRRAADGG